MRGSVRDARRVAVAHRASIAGIDAGHVASRADVDRQHDDRRGSPPIRANAAAVMSLVECVDSSSARQQRRPRGHHRRRTSSRVPRRCSRITTRLARMLAAVLLSQHRFARRASAEANEAMAVDPRDAWNYGAAGDGYMELGDYRARSRHSIEWGSCSQAAGLCAHGLRARDQGRPRRARSTICGSAADGTSPNDPESQAWHLRADRRSAAAARPRAAGADRIRARRCDLPRTSDGASIGLARIRMLDGDLQAARLMLQSRLARTATPDLRQSRRRSRRRRSATRRQPISITRWPSRSNAAPGATASRSRRCSRIAERASRPGARKRVSLRRRSARAPRRHR